MYILCYLSARSILYIEHNNDNNNNNVIRNVGGGLSGNISLGIDLFPEEIDTSLFP